MRVRKFLFRKSIAIEKKKQFGKKTILSFCAFMTKLCQV